MTETINVPYKIVRGLLPNNTSLKLFVHILIKQKSARINGQTEYVQYSRRNAKEIGIYNYDRLIKVLVKNDLVKPYFYQDPRY